MASSYIQASTAAPFTWPLDALPLKIGSAIRGGLALPDVQIAPLHACIERAGPQRDELILRIFNSRNNTTHQDQLIVQEVILHDKDHLGFGQHRFELDLSQPDTLTLIPLLVPRLDAVKPQPQPEPEAEPVLEPEHLLAIEAEFFAQPGALASQHRLEHDEPRSLEILLRWQDQIIAAHTYPQAQTLTLGSSPACDYLIDTEDPRLASFKFITHDAALGGWRLHIPPCAEGSLCWDDGWRSFERDQDDLPSPLIMNESPGGLRQAHLTLGSVCIIIRHSARAARYPRSIQPARQQLNDMGYIGLSAMLHWSALLLILSIPELGHLEPITNEHEQLVIFEPPIVHQPPTPPPSAQREDTIGDGQQQDADARHALEDGAAGDPNQPDSRQGQLTLSSKPPSKAPRHTLTSAQDQAQDSPARAGVLSILGGDAQSAGHRALTQELSAHAQTSNIGQLKLGDEAPGHGRLGLGLSGVGRGGAGEHERAIGITREPSTRSPASLGGQGLSMEHERGELSSALIVTQAAQGQGQGQGQGQNCLSPQIIARVVRARGAQLRSCYEQALTHHEHLRGRLLIQLSINPQGQVERAHILEDTLKSRRVAQCITKTIEALHFPAYQGCQIVQANYPLRFAPSDP